jgi:hypothetical protein
MKSNPILKEIRRTRDKIAEETGMSLERLFDLAKEYEHAAQARGEVVVPEPKPCVALREDAAEYRITWQRQGESATNPILAEIRQAREALMAEAGGDLTRSFEMVREREAAAKARGVVFVPVPQPKEASP